ncbi:MAG: pyruvate kinase [Clostridiales bacterium]|nr:pyruvate kinase [Clostridiales bacterium]
MGKTKIICTIGPATDATEALEKLIHAGMNVARINFSHGSLEDKIDVIERLTALRDRLQVPLALLADTRGPEIRLGRIPDGPVELTEGQIFTLTTTPCDGDASRAFINYRGLPEDVTVGGRVLIDDGLIELRVDSKTDTDIVCTVLNGGPISSHKGVNVPGVALRLPFISAQDAEDLKFIANHPFCYVAASFVRNAADIAAIRAELARHGCENMKIIAKIENAEGIENYDEILSAADAIMVARGDLGVEVPLEELPVLQKKLIKDARHRGVPVITATQMLESMVSKPRPTRAEISDVANAVYDGSSAVMLSGETAVGLFPFEACRCMARVAERTENDINYHERFKTVEYERKGTVTNAVARAAVTTAHELNCRAILTMTKSGNTARNIAKFRPAPPILACTPSHDTYHQLAFNWGVIPLIIPECDSSTTDLETLSVWAAVRADLLQQGDTAVFTAGIPLGQVGATNMLKVNVVGK